MKLIVDKMPNWRGECLFAEEAYNFQAFHCELDYKCKITDKRCGLNEDKCYVL